MTFAFRTPAAVCLQHALFDIMHILRNDIASRTTVVVVSFIIQFHRGMSEVRVQSDCLNVCLCSTFEFDFIHKKCVQYVTT